MPAGTDLIQWNPRVGDTGDDRYTVPTDAETFTTSGYSEDADDPPTLDQVNASCGWWQVLMELRRRAPTEGSYYASALTTSYPNPGIILRRSWSIPEPYKWFTIQNLRYSVEMIRALEAAANVSSPPAYSWQDSYTVPMKISKTMLFDFRKALATDHITLWADNEEWVGSPTHYPGLYQQWNYDCTSMIAEGEYATPHFCGMYAIDAYKYRYRQYRRFTVPSWIPTLGDAKIAIRKDVGTAVGNGRLYQAPFMEIVIANWGTLGTLIDEWANSLPDEFPKLIDITPPDPGDQMTFILTTDNEVNNTPAASSWTPALNGYLSACTTLRLYTS